MPNPSPTIQPVEVPTPFLAPQAMLRRGGAPVAAPMHSAPAPIQSAPPAPSSIAPMPKFAVPLSSASSVAAGVAPVPYRNLLYFADLAAVLAAIAQAKARAADQGGRFSWVRASSEPEIKVTSFADLKTAAFGRGNFKAETLLQEAIAQLPAEIASQAKANRAETLQIEGLWIEFPPKTGAETTTPHLAIAVSIALASPEPTVGSFVAKRIYLTFGDLHP